MIIFLNDVQTEIPNDCFTISDLMKWKGINPEGTAVAINDKLIPKNSWETKKISEFMHLTIITAAFGG